MRRTSIVLVLACGICAALPLPALVAQDDNTRPAETLAALEALVGWHAPDPGSRTDVRVMTRSTLGFVPLPLIRLTAGKNDQVTATVTEWGAPNSRADGRPLFFKSLPLQCSSDRSLCAGTPRVIQSPEAKALWFALFIARSCNDRARKVPSDAEDLFVRGHVAGMEMDFYCRTPNPKGPSPGDREAASILRISHRLLGR